MLYEGTACEGDYIEVSCGENTGYDIRIQSVFWGRDDNENICNEGGGTTEDCPSPAEALAAARRVCDGREKCHLGANSDAWGSV